MSETETEYPTLDESLSVRKWRCEELLRVGYSLPVATLLAKRVDVDLHKAKELMQAGCTEDTAAKILL